MELTTTEKYALAQIFVCGAIDENEFREMNDFIGTVQNDTLSSLEDKNLLDETLFQETWTEW